MFIGLERRWAINRVGRSTLCPSLRSDTDLSHDPRMSTLGFEMPAMRSGFIGGSLVLVVIGVVLLALLPRRSQTEDA